MNEPRPTTPLQRVSKKREAGDNGDDEISRFRRIQLRSRKVVRPKERSPTPPPFVLHPKVETTKRKPGPTQGDIILVNFLGNGNHPDIASRARREMLWYSDSDEENPTESCKWNLPQSYSPESLTTSPLSEHLRDPGNQLVPPTYLIQSDQPGTEKTSTASRKRKRSSIYSTTLTIYFNCKSILNSV